MKINDLFAIEKWEDLTLANNFIFCKVMEDNPDVCKQLLELLLNIKIERLERADAEKSLKIDYMSRGIRFDVYVKDGTGRSFDLEIQTTKKSDLVKRARYYHGLMDVDTLQSGIEYDALRDSYVIFLCLGDIFGYGLPVYTFRKTAEEDNSILMNDGAVTIFFNALNYDKMKNKKVRSFFEFLCGRNVKDDFSDKLSALVERLKLNARRRHEYMTWEQELKIQSRILAEKATPIMAQELAKDIAKNMAKNMAEKIVEEKTQEKIFETAKNMLKLNLTAQQIADCTGLSVAEVEELKQKTVETHD